MIIKNEFFLIYIGNLILLALLIAISELILIKYYPKNNQLGDQLIIQEGEEEEEVN